MCGRICRIFALLILLLPQLTPYDDDHHHHYHDHHPDYHQLMRAPLSYSKNGVLGGLKFADVRAYDEAVQVGDFTPFRDYAVISGRKDGTAVYCTIITPASTLCPHLPPAL